MAEVQTQAASSPAETPDVFQGQEPTMAEYDSYRTTGELPERFKPAEKAAPAPADAPKETVDDSDGDEPKLAPDSDPDKPQDPPQKETPAEKRIKQLLAKTKELERKLEAAAKPTQQSDSSTAQAPRQPQNYQEYRQSFKPSVFVEEYGKAHPDASYEDANAAMADHLLDVRDHFKGIETRENAEKQALESKVSEARNRYENFDEIKESFLSKIISDKGAPLIPLQVLGIINDSDYLADVLYTIGSDDAELAKFVEMAKANPNKAIRYVARVEGLIAEELAKPKETPVRGEDGKFKAPEKKQTSAPPPPKPVNNGPARGAFDVSDDSLSNDEWMRQRNKQVGLG